MINKDTEYYNYDINKDGFTQSLLTQWMKCPVSARTKLKGLYKPGFGSAIMFGSVFHEYMDVMLHLYQDNKFTNPEQCYDVAFMAIVNQQIKNNFMSEYIEATSEGKDVLNECYDLCAIVVPEYFMYWKDDFFGDNKKDWLEIEGEFNVKVSGGQFRGKRDGVFATKQNKKWLFETKTKSRFDDDILMKIIPRDFQVRSYMLAWYLEFGEHLQGVLYNVIRKPQLRKTVKETQGQFLQRIKIDINDRPDFYFSRYEVSISENEISKFSLSFQNTTLKFADFVSANENTDVEHIHECNSVYGACPFLDYCSSNKQDTSLLHVKTKLFSELA